MNPNFSSMSSSFTGNGQQNYSNEGTNDRGANGPMNPQFAAQQQQPNRWSGGSGASTWNPPISNVPMSYAAGGGGVSGRPILGTASGQHFPQSNSAGDYGRSLYGQPNQGRGGPAVPATFNPANGYPNQHNAQSSYPSPPQQNQFPPPGYNAHQQMGGNRGFDGANMQHVAQGMHSLSLTSSGSSNQQIGRHAPPPSNATYQQLSGGAPGYGYGIQQQLNYHHQADQRSLEYKLRADATEFVPTGGMPGYGYGGGASYAQNGTGGGTPNNFDQDDASNWLQTDELTTSICDMLSSLVTQPGLFEQISQSMLTVLNNLINTETALQFAVNLIFETAVTAAHCTYICAKLCRFLTINYGPVLFISDPSPFRRLLIKRCKEEHEMRASYEKDNPVRLCNYAMFLGELYLQIQIEQTRINVLRRALYDIIDSLLSITNNEKTLRTVVKLMKCCGAALEDDENNQRLSSGDSVPPKQMDIYIERIRNLTTSAALKQDEKDSLNSVVSLRTDNWGRRHSSTNSEPPSPGLIVPSSPEPEEVDFHDGMDHFGDEIEITQEEQDFLESCITNATQQQMNENGNEEEEAYEEFLKMQEAAATEKEKKENDDSKTVEPPVDP